MSPARENESYGQHGLSLLDRFGVAWSRFTLLRRWPDKPAVDLLDLGCGYDARLVRHLLDRVRRATVVDLRLSPELSQLPSVQAIESDILLQAPLFPPEAFDVVLLLSVLEHVEDAAGLLAQCHRVLRPGGTLFVNVPTWCGKRWLERSAFHWGLSPTLEMDDHKMYYDERDLWPMLVHAGFRPSRIDVFRHKWGLNLFASARRD